MKRFSTHIKMIILFVGSNSVNPQFSWGSVDLDDWVEIDTYGNIVEKQKEVSLLPDHDQQQDVILSDLHVTFIDDSNAGFDVSTCHTESHSSEVIPDLLSSASTPTQEDRDAMENHLTDLEIDKTMRDLMNSLVDEICEKATDPSAHQGSVVELPFDAPLSDSTSTTSGITSTTYRCDHNSITSPHSMTPSSESVPPPALAITPRVSYAMPILVVGMTLLYVFAKKT